MTGSADSSLQREVDGWFAGLSQGKIQYKIPNTMFWKEGTTITVVVQGPQAPAGSGLVEPSGESEITVSNRMRVVPSCPDNPDEFTFTPESGTTEIQFVPTNGSTRWTWSVTPKYTGASQRLQISASVLYPGQDDKVQLQLPVYTTTVNVNVPGFGDTLKRLIEGDPQYWLQYGLPGGGGFAFVVAIVTWFFTRKARRKKRSKKASPQPTGR